MKNRKIKLRWMKVWQKEIKIDGGTARITVELPFDWWTAVGRKLQELGRIRGNS